MEKEIYYQIATAGKGEQRWTLREMRGATREEALKAFGELKKEVQDDSGRSLELFECREHEDGGEVAECVATYDYFDDLCDRMEALGYPNTAEWCRVKKRSCPWPRASELRSAVIDMERGDYGDDD